MSPVERASREILRTKRAWERCWEGGAPKEVEDQAYAVHMEAVRAYGELVVSAVSGVDEVGHPRSRKNGA